MERHVVAYVIIALIGIVLTGVGLWLRHNSRAQRYRRMMEQDEQRYAQRRARRSEA